MDKRIKAAVVGLGVGAQHAHYLARRGDCEIKYLLDTDGVRLEVALKEYQAARAAKSYDEICADREIDLVCIASYDQDHARQAVQALDSGKHVFVEKPLCQTRAELEKIRAAWERSGGRLHLLCNLPLRKAPLFLWLRDEIAKGTLGEIYAADGEYLYGRMHKITEGWRRDVENYSVMEGGGIHMLDLILFLTGQYPGRVTSIGNKIATRGTGFRFDDYAVASFEFESGLIARVTANFGCVHPHQHILRLFGTKATFILDDMGARLQTNYDPYDSDNYTENRKESPRAIPLDLRAVPEFKAQMLEDMIDLIAGKAKKTLTCSEFRLMNACLAAVEAHQSRKPQNIEPFE